MAYTYIITNTDNTNNAFLDSSTSMIVPKQSVDEQTLNDGVYYKLLASNTIPTVQNKDDKNPGIVLYNWDFNAISSISNSHISVRSTKGKSQGIYYAEIKVTIPSYYGMIGIGTALASLSSFVGSDAYGQGWQNAGGGVVYHSGSYVGYQNYVSGDTLGVLLNMVNRTLTFYKNGISMGIAASDIPDGTYFLMTSIHDPGILSFINGGYASFYGDIPNEASPQDAD